MSDILAYLRSFRHLTTASEGDGELLRRFRLQRDEQAFAILIQRHGSLVLSMVRRILGQSELIDDTFQATFLVLARRGKAMEHWPSVAGWLIQVARRTAMQAQAKAARRYRHEQRAATMTNNSSTIDPADAVIQQELAARLDAELVQLPSKYRLPVVLCQLEGQTKEETAKQLGWPVGSVSGRLARGKKLLHDRLVRSGFAPSLAAGTLALSKAEAELPALLVQATTLLASNSVHQTGTLSKCTAATIAQGVMTTMFLSKMKHAAMIMLALGLGAGTAAWAWLENGVLTNEESIAPIPSHVQTAKVHNPLQGVWKLTQYWKDRVELSTSFTNPYRWFDNGKMGFGKAIDHSNTQTSYVLADNSPFSHIELKRPTADGAERKSHGIFKLENGTLRMALSESQNPRPTSFEPAENTTVYVYQKVSDYDRLEGIWRNEERNPVTNDLDRATELIFKKNMYVRRVYSASSIMEDKPLAFHLNEKTSPKQLDLEIRSIDDTTNRFAMSLTDANIDRFIKDTVNRDRVLERRLAIYELKDNEFRYAITGAIPFKLEGKQLVPNPESPLNKRAASLETAGSPILTFTRVERSLKDEGTRTPITEKPPEDQSTTANAVQATSIASRKLLEERLKIAEERMGLWKEAYAKASPSGSWNELGRISEQLLTAKLALAQNQTEKMQAMEKHLQTLKQLEQVSEAKHKAGSMLKTELLDVRLKRVEFEIQLEEMKGNPANSPLPK